MKIVGVPIWKGFKTHTREFPLITHELYNMMESGFIVTVCFLKKSNGVSKRFRIRRELVLKWFSLKKNSPVMQNVFFSRLFARYFKFFRIRSNCIRAF